MPKRAARSRAAPAPIGNRPIWTDRRAGWVVGVLLLIAIAVIYGQTLGHQLLVYDDSGIVTDNPHVNAGLTAQGLWWSLTQGPFGDWFPLALVSHMLDCQLFGLNAWGHHLTNVLLHALTAVGLFLVLWRMTDQRAVPTVAQASGVRAAQAGPSATTQRAVPTVAQASGVRAAQAGPSATTQRAVPTVAQASGVRAAQAGPSATTQRAVPTVAQASGVRAAQAGPSATTQRAVPTVAQASGVRVAQADPSANTRWPSAVAAALFAVHPQHVESVAWVAERRDVLSGLFFVLTLAAYLGYVKHGRTPARYLLVVLLFSLGLMSKTMLVTLPALLLLLDHWPLGRLADIANAERASAMRRLLWEKLPLFALSAGACLMTLRQVSTGKPHFDWSLRLAGAAVSAVAYLVDFFYPLDLVAFHGYPAGGFPIWQVAASVALLATITTAAIVWRRRFPFLLVGWCWYLGTLVPVLGLVTISNHSRADRYMYLPSIGLYIALLWGAARLATQLPALRRPAGRWVMPACAGLALVVLVTSSSRQASFWRDDETLWRHTLACDPDNGKAEFALADALARQGRTEEAIDLYRRAQAHPIDAAPFNNLGVILARQGKPAEAIEQYRQALAMQPDYFAAHVNLGIALFNEGQTAEAKLHFEQALAIQPQAIEAHGGLAHVLLGEGKIAEARAELEQALAIQPRSVIVHADLAAVLLRQGDVAGAIAHGQAALAIDPRFVPAQRDLARALAADGRRDEAATHYRAVLQIDPSDRIARRGLDDLSGGLW